MTITGQQEEQLKKRTNEDRWIVYGVIGSSDLLDRSKLDATSILNRVSVLELDGVTIATSQIADMQPESAMPAQQMREFAEIVNELHRLGDILPFRYGTILSLSDLFRALESEKSLYQTALQRIAGCSELCIRWAIPKNEAQVTYACEPADVQKPATGSEYLKARARSKHRDDGIERELSTLADGIRAYFPEACVEIVSSVGEMSTKHPSEVADTTYAVAKIELLVRRDAISSVLHAVSEMRLLSYLPTIASGPWPPFSFVQIREDAVSAICPMQRCAKTCENEAVR